MALLNTITDKVSNFWKAVIGFSVVLGVLITLGTQLTTVKDTVKSYLHDQTHEAVQEYVDDFISWQLKDSAQIKAVTDRVFALEEKHSKTFSIGLRVNENGTLYFRDIKGELHRAYFDQTHSTNIQKWYFYYDETGNKIYCY